ncbi:cytochrome P450 [Scleroderma citrinum]
MKDISGSASYFTLALCVAFVLNTWRNRTARNGFPLPPGPRGLPLIGNLLDVNVDQPWLSYEYWGKYYGASLVHSRLFGQEFVIINDERVAHELLEKRSSIYSDRPYILMNKLLGMDFNTGLLPYGNEWRLHRKMFNVAFSNEASAKYEAMQIQKSRQLLRNLLATPLNYVNHVNTMAGAVIMAITYGYDVAPENDPFVTKVVDFVQLFKDELTPERSALLNALPVLQYIPTWFPGGQLKRAARECRSLARDVLDNPVRYVRDKMAAGTARQSLVRDLFQKEIKKGSALSEEETIKAVGATVFLGGAETTSSTLLVFLLAMVLHPHVQTKAQEEIDRVVGNDRLPEFTDRQNLPYIEAILLETLRWHPVVPLSLPHMTTTEDVFEGMYIPKGKSNIHRSHIGRAMTRDKGRFPNPGIFDPTRHLTPSGEVVERTSFPEFGFGRRICPGRHVARRTLWGAIVSILATLRIGKAKDEAGYEIAIKPEYTSGLAPWV